MGALDKVEPVQVLHIEFPCHRHKQSLLIHALLKCSQLDLDKIASLLDMSPITLKNVYNGYYYLTSDKAVCLAQLFCLFFTD